MIVCIAEKPSVAGEIAKILGATQRKQGYYEGNGYQVTWTLGHLCELKYPEEYSANWRYWNLNTLPMLPTGFGIRLKDDEGVKKQFEVIETLFKNATEIVNCGDAGQEGELIQRWVMHKAKVTCPVKRLWISSMTEEAIREGFATLRPQTDYELLYKAGMSRAIGDWLLGMNATRLYTLKYGSQNKDDRRPLSVGRVQTPTLALIVNRQHEIENFIPTPYWVLTTDYREVTFTSEKGKYATEEDAQEALQKIVGHPFEVTSVEKKNGTEAPPRLFDLTSLQVECNKKFGFSAELTLQLTQSLYEKKMVTYPRVDTTFLPDDVFPKCKSILNGISSKYMDLLNPLRGSTLKKSKKVFDTSKVTDHHAIIPTGQRPAMSGDEEKVFDLIARRFISIFYPDCKFATTTILGKVEDISFKASGKQILEEGWRFVFAKDKKASDDNDEKKDDEERTLPTFVVNETGEHTPNLAQKTTQPPSYYTEATLLRAMETAGKNVDDEELRDALKENGIGRPSTRASIIETLFKRGYIRRERKTLHATPTGIDLIGIINEELLKSAELTGRWEKKLREIEAGKYDSHLFVKELKQMVTEIVNQVRNDHSNRRVTAVEKVEENTPNKKKSTPSKSIEEKTKKKTIRVGMKCPKCGQGKVIKGHTAYGCSRWKEGCNWRSPLPEGKSKKA